MTVGDLVYERALSQKNSTGYENVYASKPPGQFYTPSSAASTRLSPRRCFRAGCASAQEAALRIAMYKASPVPITQNQKKRAHRGKVRLRAAHARARLSDADACARLSRKAITAAEEIERPPETSWPAWVVCDNTYSALRSPVGRARGEALRGGAVGRRCGAALWGGMGGGAVGRRCGAALWGGAVGARAWGGAVGRRCGAARRGCPMASRAKAVPDGIHRHPSASARTARESSGTPKGRTINEHSPAVVAPRPTPTKTDARLPGYMIGLLSNCGLRA